MTTFFTISYIIVVVLSFKIFSYKWTHIELTPDSISTATVMPYSTGPSCIPQRGNCGQT